MKRLRRLPTARVVRGDDALTLVHPDGTASRLEGASGALGEAVLELFDAEPRTRGDVLRAIAAMAEEPFEDAVIDELLALMTRAGVLGPAVEGEAAARPASGLRVVVGVTGAIQAMDAPRLVRLLQQRGHEVRVAATKAAERFVSLPVLAALTHRRPATGLWGPPDRPAAHIELAAWADVVLVYPASATTLSRIARGDCSDVVSATAIATRAPVVLAPSMNEDMLRAPSIARNLETLREDGFFVVEPSLGVEVADAPGRRESRSGVALAPEHIVDVVAVVAQRRAAAPQHDWERAYVDQPKPPWHVDVVPEDLAKALADCPPPGALLDVGTGLGTIAIHAAERGYSVVATDVSPTALARAAARAGSLPITFLRDDATRTRLASAFDVVVDRGCLHVLSPHEAPAYAAALARLVRTSGALILVSDGDKARADRGTQRRSPIELAIQLPLFDLERVAPTTLTPDEPGAAWLTVWRRRRT